MNVPWLGSVVSSGWMTETMYVPASVDCGTKLNVKLPLPSVATLILRWKPPTWRTIFSVALPTDWLVVRSLARPVIVMFCTPYDVAGEMFVTSPV